eukprot:scaffold15073_cov43-Phaeocystis_antarctica.AAC.4
MKGAPSVHPSTLGASGSVAPALTHLLPAARAPLLCLTGTPSQRVVKGSVIDDLWEGTVVERPLSTSRVAIQAARAEGKGQPEQASGLLERWVAA